MRKIIFHYLSKDENLEEVEFLDDGGIVMAVDDISTPTEYFLTPPNTP